MASSTPKKHERGAALVEAAIVVPFLLLLVFGVVDIARAYFDSAAVQEAAIEGVLFASLNPGDPSTAISLAEDTVSSPDLTGQVTVTCPSATQVTVTVAYTFDVVTPVLSNIVGSTIDLTHAETAQVLSSDPCVPSP